jgi:WD40 repeat protein
VWDTRRQEQLHKWEADTTWTIEYERAGRKMPEAALGRALLAVTPDGYAAVSAGHDCFMRLWSLELPGPLKVFPLNTECTSTAVSANGGHLVCASGTELQIRSVSTGEVLRSRSSALSGQTITALVLTPDSSIAVTGTSFGTIEIWDLTYVSSPQSEPLRSNVRTLTFC